MACLCKACDWRKLFTFLKDHKINTDRSHMLPQKPKMLIPGLWKKKKKTLPSPPNLKQK
jgi:hypothetical protein